MISEQELLRNLRDIPDFPKKGIMFKDMTPLLSNPQAFNAVIDHFAKEFTGKGITRIVGIESRGFIFAAALASNMEIGFVPIRKKGKLPYKTLSASFDLEYGKDTLEIHTDALSCTDKVIIVDDLLATGGTINAAIELVEKLGAKVHCCAFVCDLAFLNGRAKVKAPIKTLVTL